MSPRKIFYSLKRLTTESASDPEFYSTRYHEDPTSISKSLEARHEKFEPIAFKPFLGLVYICFHAAFNQLASVIVKLLSYINPCQLSLIRNIGIFVGILPIAVYHTDQIFGKKINRPLLILRSIFGATAFYLQIMAYSYLPHAEASIVMSTLPFVTAVMARIILKEPYGIVQSISLVMSVCGVLLSLRIPELLSSGKDVCFYSTCVTGLMASLGNVFHLTLSTVYMRKLRNVHFTEVMFYLGTVGLIENSIFDGIFVPFSPLQCGFDQILCVLLGVFCFISNYFLTSALQIEPAGLASVQKSSFDILMIIVFQLLFFNIYPDSYVICGACLVITSVTIIGVKNWISTMPVTSKIRENLKCLLR